VTVKFGTKLPKKDDRNGLHSIAGQLLRDPERARLAVVVFDVGKITRDIEGDDVYPTVRVVAIEPINGGVDVGKLRAMLQRAYADRTGNVELPGDWEQVFAELTSPPLPGSEPGSGA
jgi:hypothetical protein